MDNFDKLRLLPPHCLVLVGTLALLSDGNSEHAKHAGRKKKTILKNNPICDCARSNQMPSTDRSRAHPFLITIYYKYHDNKLCHKIGIKNKN